MRVAFPATAYLDPTTPRSWSGLPYFMRRALEGEGVETVIVPLPETARAGSWARFAWWRLRGRRYLRGCESGRLRAYARELERRLPDLEVDAVFSPSSWLIAYLRTDLPMYFWTDACFAGMVDFYPSFTRLAPPSLRAGHAAERAALSGCRKAIYSSAWAAETARAAYGVDPAKVAVIPFGANVPEAPSPEAVEAAVAARAAGPWRLLLVGVEWERKGCAIAVEALRALLRRGRDARLTIVGCVPPPGTELPPEVEVIPFIGKVTPEERRRFAEVFLRSHFFVMPTRAEAYGLVYSEANIYGVPCLATDVGGLPSVVANDVNGRLFSLAAGGETYAAYVDRILSDPHRYRTMALRSAEEARQRLSWEAAGRRLRLLLGECQGGAGPLVPERRLARA
ncbi:MAG TPA: glycosyltransferase family 4 protein [Opitutaceae bacterium]|nr:glycosyltransferase family 4 protein [Opitutaceae bacterium]